MTTKEKVNVVIDSLTHATWNLSEDYSVSQNWISAPKGEGIRDMCYLTFTPNRHKFFMGEEIETIATAIKCVGGHWTVSEDNGSVVMKATIS